MYSSSEFGYSNQIRLKMGSNLTSANCGPPWSSLSAAPPCSSRASVTHSSSGPHRSQSRSRAELRFGYRTWINLLPTARRSRRMVSFTGSSSVENSSSLLDVPTGTEMSPSTGMSSEIETSDSPANGLLASSVAAILPQREDVFTKAVNYSERLDDVNRVHLIYYKTRQRQKRHLFPSNSKSGSSWSSLSDEYWSVALHVSWGMFTSAWRDTRKSGWYVHVHLLMRKYTHNYLVFCHGEKGKFWDNKKAKINYSSDNIDKNTIKMFFKVWDK